MTGDGGDDVILVDNMADSRVKREDLKKVVLTNHMTSPTHAVDI